MNYEQLATQKSIEKTIKSLTENGLEAFVVENGDQALQMIKELVPSGVSVMNGASLTLEKIGYVEYLKSGEHGWDNLHGKIFAETDRAKQLELRKQATLSDYYLGSVHAVAETGEFVIGSNTGSQLPHIAYTSSNLIFVVSTKKIVPTLTDAVNRLEQYVVPLEDENIMVKFNIHTMLAKVLIFKKENPMMGRKVRMIFIKEDLGN